MHVLLGMLRTAKGKKEDAANAYAAAVRISLVSLHRVDMLPVFALCCTRPVFLAVAAFYALLQCYSSCLPCCSSNAMSL